MPRLRVRAPLSPPTSTPRQRACESEPVNDIAVILFLLIGMSMMGFAGAKGPTAGRPLIGVTGIICFAAGIVVAVA